MFDDPECCSPVCEKIDKTNLLVTSTRSSVCCANLILGFSVNFVHKKHLAECYQ